MSTGLDYEKYELFILRDVPVFSLSLFGGVYLSLIEGCC